MPIEELRRLAAEAAAVAAEAGVVAGTVVATEQPEEEVHRLVSQVMAVRLQPEQQTSLVACSEEVKPSGEATEVSKSAGKRVKVQKVDLGPTSQPMGTYKVPNGLSGCTRDQE
jgi:hypothetical protein